MHGDIEFDNIIPTNIEYAIVSIINRCLKYLYNFLLYLNHDLFTNATIIQDIKLQILTVLDSINDIRYVCTIG